MRDNIKQWYITTYPTDDLGQDLNGDALFKDLYRALDYGEDIYRLFGVHDSLVRERLFARLADIIDCDYEDIYSQWIYGGYEA